MGCIPLTRESWCRDKYFVRFRAVQAADEEVLTRLKAADIVMFTGEINCD
jgi:hypothetical protein